MANYIDTQLQAARAWQNENLNDKFEKRDKNTFLLDMCLEEREFTIPMLDEIRMADTQATEVLYEKQTAFTSGTAKSCNPTGAVGDSGIVTPTWATATAAFEMSVKRHKGNELSYAKALASQLLQAEDWILKNSPASVDAAIAAYLETNRTQVNAADGVGQSTWNGIDFKAEFDNADLERFYNYLDSEMALNDYNGEFMEAVNTMWVADWAYIRNQGEGNSTNTAFQLVAPYQWTGFPSKLIAPATGEQSVHYIVPKGGIALIDWNDPANRQKEVRNGKEWTTYASRRYPGLTFDVFLNRDCADTSASGGSTQDPVDTYEVAFNYAILHAPLSTANETPIFKYVVKTT